MHPALSVIIFTVASGAGYGLLALLGFGAAIGVMPGSRLFGGTAMALSLALVTGGLLSATGMIYASLRPIRQWCTGWTVANYLALALASGAVWLAALLRLYDRPAQIAELTAVLALVAAYLVKLVYWRVIDNSRPIATSG